MSAVSDISIKRIDNGVLIEYVDRPAGDVGNVFDSSRRVACKLIEEIVDELLAALPGLSVGHGKPEPQSVKDAGEFETKAPERAFKVGDRVRVTNPGIGYVGQRVSVGEIATVVGFSGDDLVGIQFDRDVDGHDCEGSGKKRHCVWVLPWRIELAISANSIIFGAMQGKPSSQHPMNAEAIRDTDEKEAKLRRDIELACALFGCFPVVP